MEKERIIDVCSIIAQDLKRGYLLQKKDMGYPWFPGKWCLFGGGVEKGENPQEALEREMIEEGIKLENITFLYTGEYKDQCNIGIRRGKHHIYSGINTSPLRDIRLGEGAGFAFFAREEITEMANKIVEHDLIALLKYIQKSN